MSVWSELAADGDLRFALFVLAVMVGAWGISRAWWLLVAVVSAVGRGLARVVSRVCWWLGAPLVSMSVRLEGTHVRSSR